MLLRLVSIFLLFLPIQVFADNELPKLKVGIIAPLSGGVANWGLSIRTAIEIANLRSPYPAEFYFEDEETCSTRKALDAYRHLTSVKKVDIIIASCLEGAQAIAPLAAKADIPFFISGRTSDQFQRDYPNALSWLSVLDAEGAAIAELITEKKWKAGRAMVWADYFGFQFAKGIEAATKKDKLDFSYNVVELAQSSTPSGVEIQLLLRDSPDVVFLMMSEGVAAYTVKQLKAFKYPGAVVLQSSMLQSYDPAVRKKFIGSLQQKFIVDEKLFQELRNEIKEKLGEEVADDFVFSFDGFSVLLESAEKCRNESSGSLNKCLTETMRDEQWREGASGKFRFMKDGSTERPMVFKTITETGLK